MVQLSSIGVNKEIWSRIKFKPPAGYDCDGPFAIE